MEAEGHTHSLEMPEPEAQDADKKKQQKSDDTPQYVQLVEKSDQGLWSGLIRS